MRAEAPRLPGNSLVPPARRRRCALPPVPLLIVLLLAVLALLLSAGRYPPAGPVALNPEPSAIHAPAAPPAVAWRGPALPPSHRPPSADLVELGRLRQSSDLAGVGTRLPLLTLPLQHTLREEVRLACALVHRPDGLSARVDLDAMRRPWLDALQQRCAGLPASALLEVDPSDPALQVWRAHLPANVARRQGPLAAEQAAWQLLRESADAVLLYEALRHLQLRGALPRERIFPAASRPVAIDLEALLLPAADLVACQRSASCGADGLWTLYSCAQLGCPAGSDLPAALHWQLPRVPYENVRKLAGWLLEGAPEH